MTEKTYRDLLEGLITVMRQNGSLKSALVESAFRRVPRHLFLPELALERVYSDAALMVKKDEEGRWTSSSSQPSMMAIMLEQLDLRPGQRVLEIGTGSGYNAALMAEIVSPEGSVITIDIQPDLIEAARRALDSAGFSRVQTVVADGGYGYPEGAPYDRIILTVGSYSIAPAWREQLKEGGILVLPLEVTGMQKSTAFERRGDELVSRSLSDCGFMPLQGAFAAPEQFKMLLEDDSRLYVQSKHALPDAVSRLADWLAAPPVDLPSGVQAPMRDFMMSLTTWMELHLAQQTPMLELVARQELADQGRIPPFFALGGEWKSMTTPLIIEREGGAALTLPPGHPLLWFYPSSTAEAQQNPMEKIFDLYVRQLGPDPRLAERLLGLIRAWDAAGRPGSERMRLRAVPEDASVQPEDGEFLLEKPWTQLLVKYRLDETPHA